MQKQTFHLISLGCAKNTVDSESMSQLLGASGYIPATDPSIANIMIVNTCGFIGPAKEESLKTLGELAAQKRPDQMLIAAGCLTQRYGVEVARLVPGIDGIIGTRNWMDIVEVIQKFRQNRYPKPIYHLPDLPHTVMDDQGVMRVAFQGASAYIKIADGCRRPCAFCAIPLIKGTPVSRPMNVILDEAKLLQENGVKELILIAQDTTDYGRDLGLKDGLAELLERLVETLQDSKNANDASAGGVSWIRVMYAYPGYVTDRLMEVMAAHHQILPYLDIPLQHAAPSILRSMRRPANIDWVYRTLEKMRTIMPDLALRTTFIVGYPGESREAFTTLLNFIEEIRFDKVGAFKYSFEAGTASEMLGNPIPSEVKQARWEQLMVLQQRISLEKNQALVGKTLNVLIEGHGDNISVGRTYRDAPEIDGLTVLDGEFPLGEMVQTRITSAFAYDLSGVPLNEETKVSFAKIESA